MFVVFVAPCFVVGLLCVMELLGCFVCVELLECWLMLMLYCSCACNVVSLN